MAARSRIQPSESLASIRSRSASVLPASTSSTTPCSRVSLNISCKDLPNKDIIGKSDPLCVLFFSSPTSTNNTWVELTRTEEVSNNLNPVFTTPLVLDYRFEEVQNLRFVIVDIDDRTTTSLAGQDFLGEFKIPLSRIITAPFSTVTAPLIVHNKPIAATITIKAEELVESKQVVNLQFTANNLERKDFFGFGKSDPYLVISRAREDGSWLHVHKTECKKANLNPVWAPFQIGSSLLCNSDPLRPLRIQCCDWNLSGKIDPIGETTTTLDELMSGKDEWFLVNPEKKAKKKNYKHSGILRLRECKVQIVPSFLDYIRGGCEMEFMVAIDFTQSNLVPTDPKSLHYSTNTKMSDYEKAIRAVGKIIAEYDTDKNFPVVAFGARYLDTSGNHVVSHCLSLTDSEEGAHGVEGIVQAYKDGLARVDLWGPTIFAQVVKWASSASARPLTQTSQHYTVLLIITDGIITDMQQTVDTIIDASKNPLSIIIVGVGGADFTAMDELDSDDALLTNGSKTAERDIVQFVPFRDFVNKSEETLALHTLEEIPGQLVSHMQSRGIFPIPPRSETAFMI